MIMLLRKIKCKIKKIHQPIELDSYRMGCKQWTLATATFLLLILSFWSFINAILLCMSKYLYTDIHLFIPHTRHGSLQIIKTTTPNVITVVNTSLFVY
ncbi:hypothetical protein I4U23_020367 [Adineta vaga]|nr:hypothetical protein I4U23_020367 [Adineta vaga]